MRYKKQIVIICLFTFLFMPLNISYAENLESPQPIFDFVITPTILYGLGELAVAMGCVALTAPTLMDIGQRVVNTIESTDFDSVSNYIKDGFITVTDKLLGYIGSAIKELPQTDVVSEEKVSPGSSGYYTFSIPSSFSTSGSYIFNTIDIPEGTHYFILKFYSGSDVVSTTSFNVPYVSWFGPAELVMSYDLSMKAYYIRLFYANLAYGKTYVSLGATTSVSFKCDTIDDVYSSVTIPYDETVNKDYNDEKPLTTFPGVMGGTHSSVWELPTDTYYEENINSFPLTSENVSDKINEIPLDTSTDSGVTDIPNTDVGDTPVTGDSLWDTLLSWLRSLIQPIIDLLTAILGFFTGLLDKLRELLIELFVPSEGIFVDTFNCWKSDLESKFGLDLSVIDGLQSVEEQGVKDIEFTVMGVDVVLPISFVNKFASTSRTFTTGLVIIFLVWYQYRNAYKLVRNSESIQGDGGGKK